MLQGLVKSRSKALKGPATKRAASPQHLQLALIATPALDIPCQQQQ